MECRKAWEIVFSIIHMKKPKRIRIDEEVKVRYVLPKSAFCPCGETITWGIAEPANRFSKRYQKWLKEHKHS